MDDEILLAKAKRRADEIAQTVGPGKFVMALLRELGVAVHFSTDTAGAQSVEINRGGREAFEHIVFEATGTKPQLYQDCIAMDIPDEGHA